MIHPIKQIKVVVLGLVSQDTVGKGQTKRVSAEFTICLKKRKIVPTSRPVISTEVSKAERTVSWRRKVKALVDVFRSSKFVIAEQDCIQVIRLKVNKASLIQNTLNRIQQPAQAQEATGFNTIWTLDSNTQVWFKTRWLGM